jgi:hypothetical protein
VRTRVGPGLLFLVLAAGCGGVEAPSDAGVGEFCAVWDRLAEARTGPGLRAFGAALEQVGTPPGIPPDAREGFEVVVRAVADLGPDDDLDDLAAEGLSDADLDDAGEFLGYGRRTCGRPGAGG